MEGCGGLAQTSPQPGDSLDDNSSPGSTFWLLLSPSPEVGSRPSPEPQPCEGVPFGSWQLGTLRPGRR